MNRKLILGTALAALLAGASLQTAPVQAAKDPNKVKGKKGEKTERPMQNVTPDMLGKILGKDLTDDQKTQVKDANKAYGEAIAKAAGLTLDELKAKMVEYRKANPRAGGKPAGEKKVN